MESQHTVPSDVAVWAIAYGLPRRTYAAADAVDLIRFHWDAFTATQRDTVQKVVDANPVRAGEYMMWPLAQSAMDDDSTPTDAPTEITVSASTLIWAVRHAMGHADLIDPMLKVVLDEWDHITTHDRHVISRDLFYPVSIDREDTTWHSGPVWDALVARRTNSRYATS